MKKLIIVGAGGMGREVLQWAKDINIIEHKWEIVGFIDDNLTALQGIACSHKVIGKINDWTPSDDEEFVCAIAEPSVKLLVVSLLKSKNANFATFIHPSSSIGENNEIGEGVVIYPGVLITVNTKIGDFVTLLSSSIGHDVIIGEYSSIMGACSINGGVNIGRNVFLGCNVVTVPKRKIGDNAYVAAGSVIILDVKEGTKVIGNPGRRYK